MIVVKTESIPSLAIHVAGVVDLMMANRTAITIPVGFTLLEILLALLVASVGILGIGMLQVKSLQYTQSGLINTQAAALAWDISERIRLNAGQHLGYEIAADDPYPPENCVTKSCSPDEIITSDLHLWRTAIAQALPQGKGEIVVPKPLVVTVTITWQESGESRGFAQEIHL